MIELFSVLLEAVCVPQAHAQALDPNLSNVLRAIAGPFLQAPSCSGPECFIVVVRQIIAAFRPLMTIAAVFIIVRSGLVLIYRSSEEELGKAKRAISVSATAVILFYLAPALTDAFFGGLRFGQVGGAFADPGTHAVILSIEIFGLIRWATVFVAVGAVTIIIYSGVRAIGNFGSDTGLSQLRQTVIGVVGGILILITTQAIVNTIGVNGTVPRAAPIILRAVEIFNGLLLLITIAAIAILVYAGFMMIFFMGDEERYNQAKSLVIRCLIGIVVIVVSFLIIRFVVQVMLGA